MLKRLLDPGGIIRVQNWSIETPVPLAIAQVLGVAWPKNTGDVVTGSSNVISVGPTDWLVIIIDSDVKPWLRRIEATLEDSTCRATDVSQSLARIRISGFHTRELLAKGCSLDLHPPRFPPGRCARTRFAGMPVIVQCTADCTFECLVTLSYAEYLLQWLADAALEFTEPEPEQRRD